MNEAVATTDEDDGLLDVGALVRMFEESENATSQSRSLSERDRDYYDSKQWTASETATQNRRGQPVITDNIVKTKVDYLDGTEKQQRIEPKAIARTPQHEQDADGATDALRFVTQSNDYDKKRSSVWRNMLIEGAGGLAVSVKESTDYRGQPGVEVEIKKVPWDRMFYDPHSSEPDFSDASYLGLVVWMNYSDAIAMYPDSKDALDTTIDSAPSATYDDKPKFALWADKSRKRVRVCQIWIKRADHWYFAEFTKGGILKAGPSPYVTDKGESDCELFFQSAYVDRENNRYGFVRELISLQDEVNKRRSKSMHLMSTKQVHYEQGAVADPQDMQKKIHKPDAAIEYLPGALSEKKVLILDGLELAQAQFQMLQEAKNAIDLKGPNATEMGDKTGVAGAASGKAIIASQQGGMTQLAHLSDRLRDLDIRVFRAVWARIRQYWTAEKWIRVTDDPQNIKWVGINVDPQQVQTAMANNPQIAGKIKGAVSSVAELDCDIWIDEAPDSLTPELEQFSALVELKKYDVTNEIPFKSIVRASPNLKVKNQIMKDIEQREQQQSQAQQPMQQLQFRGAQAEVAETESKAALNMAKARDVGMPDGQPQGFELPPELQNAQALADIDDKHASAQHKRAQAFHITREAELAPARFAREAQQPAA